MKGDLAAVAQIQDQLSREVRWLHVEWEEKKAALHGEPTEYEARSSGSEKDPPSKSKPAPSWISRAKGKSLDRPRPARWTSYLGRLCAAERAEPARIYWRSLRGSMPSSRRLDGRFIPPQLRHTTSAKKTAPTYLQDRDGENLLRNCGR